MFYPVILSFLLLLLLLSLLLVLPLLLFSVVARPVVQVDKLSRRLRVVCRISSSGSSSGVGSGCCRCFC